MHWQLHVSMFVSARPIAYIRTLIYACMAQFHLPTMCTFQLSFHFIIPIPIPVSSKELTGTMGPRGPTMGHSLLMTMATQ